MGGFDGYFSLFLGVLEVLTVISPYFSLFYRVLSVNPPYFSLFYPVTHPGRYLGRRVPTLVHPGYTLGGIYTPVYPFVGGPPSVHARVGVSHGHIMYTASVSNVHFWQEVLRE